MQSETKLDRDFFDKNQPAADVTLFRETFETTKRFKLRPGSYAVIPTTFDPNKEGEFLLRIFSEKKEAIGAKSRPGSYVDECEGEEFIDPCTIS